MRDIFAEVELTFAFWQLEADQTQLPDDAWHTVRSLPFGLMLSSQCFWNRILQDLDDLSRVLGMAIDILVFGKYIWELN